MRPSCQFYHHFISECMKRLDAIEAQIAASAKEKN